MRLWCLTVLTWKLLLIDRDLDHIPHAIAASFSFITIIYSSPKLVHSSVGYFSWDSALNPPHQGSAQDIFVNLVTHTRE